MLDVLLAVELVDAIDLEVGPSGRIHEHGWQSWSPAGTYALDDRPPRPTDPDNAIMQYRAGRAPAPGVFQGEGLLAVQAEPGGPVHVLGAVPGSPEVPSIVATPRARRVEVRSTGPVEHVLDDGAGGLDGALARWGDRFAAGAGVGPIRPAPTGWCSWYHYFLGVSEADMDENLAAIVREDLPAEVVQLDDGYEAGIGDWLELSDRFASLPAMSRRIRNEGRRAGIWVAPFLLGANSRVFREHPDWAIGGGDAPAGAGSNWDQPLFGLDTTHPGAQDWLTTVFATLRDMGFDYFKIDFLYGGALDGQRWSGADPIAAYREGLGVVRRAIGDAYLVGCGAPILPSVGLVDAMRISPDTGPEWVAASGDPAHPGGHAAVATGVGRAWQHGRFWVNDPDCLLVRPAVERREVLAAHVERYGGLRMSSDRIAELDTWGLETTRRLLARVPVDPFIPS